MLTAYDRALVEREFGVQRRNAIPAHLRDKVVGITSHHGVQVAVGWNPDVGVPFMIPIPRISGGASPLQVADASQQRVARRPQTTEPPAGGGPFLRHTRPSRQQGFSVTGQAFGALINQPLKAVPGFLRFLDITVTASGGSGTATAAADAPWNVLSQITFKDAFGQVVASYGGFELAKIVNMYSGQAGFWNSSDPANLPSFSDVATAASVGGNFKFHVILPLEVFDGFCAIPSANASAVPQLTIQLAPAASVYSAAPATTTPTIQVDVEESYYAIPLDDPNLAPPDNGSSMQWIQQTAPTSIGGAAFQEVTLPPLGSWVSAIAFCARTGAGARSDTIFPAATNTIELWIDGVPEYVTLMSTHNDWMFKYFGVTRPTGVEVFTYRNSEANFGPVSSLDTGDLWLPTTPGSLLTLRGTWQGAGSLTVLAGRVYAAGGIPYTHLAD